MLLTVELARRDAAIEAWWIVRDQCKPALLRPLEAPTFPPGLVGASSGPPYAGTAEAEPASPAGPLLPIEAV